MGELDRDIYLWVTEHRIDWLDPIFLGLTWIGYAGLVWIVLAAVLSWSARRPPLGPALAVAATVWTVDLFAGVLKALIDRPRPFTVIDDADPLTTHVVGQSFPSGHAATSFAGAVMLGVLFRRAAPWLLVLAVAISYSRVYIGVHYLGDVLAGAALGTIWAVGGLAIYYRGAPWIRARRARAYSGRAP